MDYTKTDLAKISGVSANKLNHFLNDTALEGLGEEFAAVEQKFGINAIYFLAHAIHESDFGRSRIARDKKNLFGWRAYDRNPYDNAMRFDSYEHCIDTVAGFIKRNYLTPGGTYYEGPTLEGMNTHYATDPYWAKKIARWMERVYNALPEGPDYKGHWAEADIQQAIKLGIAGGIDNEGNFAPDRSCTRAESISFLMRAIRLILQEQ